MKRVLSLGVALATVVALCLTAPASWRCTNASGAVPGPGSSLWQIETIAGEPDVGYECTLAYDKEGYPAITYYDYGNSNWKFARHDGSRWRVETVRVGSIAESETYLAFDGEGFPAVAYQTRDDGRSIPVWWDGAGWQQESFLEGASAIEMAFSSNGFPRFAYTMKSSGEGSSETLMFAELSQGGWMWEEVCAQGNFADFALALDSNGDPAVAFITTSHSDGHWGENREFPKTCTKARG